MNKLVELDMTEVRKMIVSTVRGVPSDMRLDAVDEGMVIDLIAHFMEQCSDLLSNAMELSLPSLRTPSAKIALMPLMASHGEIVFRQILDKLAMDALGILKEGGVLPAGRPN